METVRKDVYTMAVTISLFPSITCMFRNHIESRFWFRVFISLFNRKAKGSTNPCLWGREIQTQRQRPLFNSSRSVCMYYITDRRRVKKLFLNNCWCLTTLPRGRMASEGKGNKLGLGSGRAPNPASAWARTPVFHPNTHNVKIRSEQSGGTVIKMFKVNQSKSSTFPLDFRV